MVLGRVMKTGYKVEEIDLEKAFNEVRIVWIEAGELLIERGSSSHFIYIPFSEGLRCNCRVSLRRCFS